MSATKNLVIEQQNTNSFKFKHGWRHYQTDSDIFLRIDTMLDSIITNNNLFINSLR